MLNDVEGLFLREAGFQGIDHRIAQVKRREKNRVNGHQQNAENRDGNEHLDQCKGPG
jgi:hypothetical protein